MMMLGDNVRYLKGVGPRLGKILEKLGVRTLEDLLYFLPSRHIDRSSFAKIRQLREGTKATLHATVLRTSSKFTGGGYKIFEAILSDGIDTVPVLWFNQLFLSKIITPGAEIIVYGTVKLHRRISMVAEEFELVTSEDQELLHTGGLIPVYPSTSGMSQKIIRKIVKSACDSGLDGLMDPIPPSLAIRRGLITASEAIVNAHYPSGQEALAKARKRLKYEELFLFEISMAMRKNERKSGSSGMAIMVSPTIDSHIRARFPFKLTKAQERAVADIRSDIESGRPMNRLLQGDVGSGKTAVALYAMLSAIGNKRQAAIMAPTEILAEQHFRNVSNYLSGSKVRIALFTGSTPRKERTALAEGLAKGEIDLAIGTHALIEKDIRFKDLAVAVVDEQHKFGVLQRGAFTTKGLNPHVLVMTATPIPRTLAMTVFGDLDVSIIDELPPGRRPIKTLFKTPDQLPVAFEFIRSKIKEGRQSFFVYPLINDSDKLALKSATQMAKYISKEIYPELKVDLLHGGMKPAEKEAVMTRFRDGTTDILVSTIVIEVGIDVPNASIMVIDHAERYGLAQLHQLRGRVGRGSHDSFCVLFGKPVTPEARQRIAAMEETNDGFRIAEEDLKLRGPGEFLGTRQSGLPEFRIANLVEDADILIEARDDAFNVIAKDPGLRSLENAPIASCLKRRALKLLDLSKVC